MGSKRVELFAAIRWDRQREGTSVRALADKYGVHRRTVRHPVRLLLDAYGIDLDTLIEETLSSG